MDGLGFKTRSMMSRNLSLIPQMTLQHFQEVQASIPFLSPTHTSPTPSHHSHLGVAPPTMLFLAGNYHRVVNPEVTTTWWSVRRSSNNEPKWSPRLPPQSRQYLQYASALCIIHLTCELEKEYVSESTLVYPSTT